MAETNWKNHPAVILGGTFTAGVLFATGVVVPVYTASQQNSYDAKVKAIEEKFAKNEKDFQKLDVIVRENKFLKEQMIAARVELWSISNTNPFRPNQPVPKGLEALKAGMTIEQVKQVLPELSVEKGGDETFYLMLPGGNLIKKAMLSMRRDKIWNVSYLGEEDATSKIKLYTAIVQALGKPAEVDRELYYPRVAYRWKIGKESATLVENHWML